MSKWRYQFEKFSKNNVLLSILMVVLGVVLFIWPRNSLQLASKILGIALLIGSVVSAYSWYRDRHKVSAGYTMLALAILLLVMGLVVLFAMEGLLALLPKLIGLAILVNGVINLAQVLELRNVPNGSWGSSMVMAVLTIALGAFLLFFSTKVISTLIMVIGGVLVYNGVSNLWIESRYKKMGR